MEDNKTPSTPAGVCLLRTAWLFALFDAEVLAFWNPQKMLTFYYTLGHTVTLRLRPQLTVLVWKRGFFSSGLSYHPHISGQNGNRKRIFSKRFLEWRFLKTPLDYRFCVNRGKRRFSNKMMPYIMQHMPFGARNRISIVFACSRGRAKTIQIRSVRSPIFRKRINKPPFSKISGYVWTRP